MKDSDRKILFTDIDETLVTTDKKLTDGNRRAIEDFLSRGNVLSITTGRALAAAAKLVKSLGLYGRERTYICAFNGGQIFDTYHEKTLFRLGIEPGLAAEANAYAREYGIHIHAYSDAAVISEQDNSNLRTYCRLQNLPFRLVPDLAESIEGGSCKLLAVDFDHPERVTEFRDILLRKMDGRLNIFKSNDWLLEIVPNGVSKGAAVHFLADQLHVPMANTISAGDEENDLPMIREAHIGCAMKNAKPMLKEAADYITEHDNNHNGIAEIIDRFADCSESQFS